MQFTDSYITVEAKIHSGASQQGPQGRQLDTPKARAGIPAITKGTRAITDASSSRIASRSRIVRNSRNARKSRDASNSGYAGNCRDSSNIINVSESEGNVANNSRNAGDSRHVSNSSERSNSSDAVTAMMRQQQ